MFAIIFVLAWGFGVFLIGRILYRAYRLRGSGVFHTYRLRDLGESDELMYDYWLAFDKYGLFLGITVLIGSIFFICFLF